MSVAKSEGNSQSLVEEGDVFSSFVGPGGIFNGTDRLMSPDSLSSFRLMDEAGKVRLLLYFNHKI